MIAGVSSLIIKASSDFKSKALCPLRPHRHPFQSFQSRLQPRKVSGGGRIINFTLALSERVCVALPHRYNGVLDGLDLFVDGWRGHGSLLCCW